MPADVRTNGITVTKNTAGFLGAHRLLLAGQPVRLAVHQQLPRPLRARRAQARAGRRQRHHLRRAQVRDAAVARSRQARRRAASRPATSSSALREQNVQVAAGSDRRRAGAPRPDVSAQRARARAGSPRSRSSRTSSSRPGKDGALVRVKDVGRVELGAENYSSRPALRAASRRRASASSCCRRPTRSRRSRACMDEMARLREELPAGPQVAARLRQRRASSASRSSRC